MGEGMSEKFLVFAKPVGVVREDLSALGTFRLNDLYKLYHQKVTKAVN